MTLCFGIFIDSFLFWRFDHFGKAPYKKLYVCMYVCKTFLKGMEWVHCLFLFPLVSGKM